MRQNVIGMMADRSEVERLRAQGLSWSEIMTRFRGSPVVNLTREQAEALTDNGFAFWAERHNRVLITARLEAFARLRDLSALAGEFVAGKRKEGWIGVFLRSQFLKPESR